MKQILQRGVGVHHAGMLPRYRRIVEDLFQRKLLSVAVCTETLAAGINLPARSVVLTSLLKGPPREKKLIDASSAHQMFGRAGRPQFDTQGFVIALAHEDDVKIARWKEKYDTIPEDTKDPRLREAFIADDPARVIQFFDGLGVRYLYLIDLERTAILESEIALAHAIQSSAFELIVEFPGAWYLYRRADEPSETEFEISDGLAVDSIGRGAWTVVQDLAPGLRADSFRDREQTAATLLQLGPEAAKAIRWFSRKSTDAPSRRWCLKIARTIESESFTAMDALRSLQAFDGKRFARATDPDHPFTGPQLADQLQIIATLRGVSIADSAQGFFTKIVERSAAANDGYRVVLEDGSRRDLVEWLTEQITPAVESGAESG